MPPNLAFNLREGELRGLSSLAGNFRFSQPLGEDLREKNGSMPDFRPHCTPKKCQLSRRELRDRLASGHAALIRPNQPQRFNRLALA